MKKLSTRCHDVVDNVNGAYQSVGQIHDILEHSIKKNIPVDFQKIMELSDEAIDSLNKTVEEFMVVKKIVYELGDQNKDYDHLIEGNFNPSK